MQNKFTYWRAAHPLVFISAHLIIGVLIANYFSYSKVNTDPRIGPIACVGIGLISLFILIAQNRKYIFQGICVSLILISWGMAISWASKLHEQVHFDYSEYWIVYGRNLVVAKINKYIVDKEANGFSLAILLGIKSDMNKDLLNAYTQLGIVHIIAISGMHLEILFKNLKRITQLMPRHGVYLILELILLLGIVWMYTLMAFASPSIVRASLFFTIYTLGKFFGASAFMLNTIAGGILILLVFNLPGIHHIGLQLSYGAVIGIQLFYKPLYQSLPMDNPLLRFLWSNCCTSLSAQLTTFPLLAFHFHQIAGWVLVSNFIMVPLSNYILYGLGILLLLPDYFSIAHYWGKWTQTYILFFNQFVNNWYDKTGAATYSVKMYWGELTLYYIILLFVYLWLYLKQSRWLLAVLVVLTSYACLKLFS